MPWIEIFLALAVFVISFFSVMSGGIGLLTRPLLILAGFPPGIAIGTFRIANLAARLSGLISFRRNHVDIDFKLALILFIPSFIGGIIGAEIVSIVDPERIKHLLGVFILFMGVILLIKKEAGLIDLHHVPTKGRNIIGFFSMIAIGVVAVFIGGSGILFGSLLIFLYDKSFISSAPIRKVANFGSALSASILFIYHGLVNWYLMIIILIADGLGEYLGAKYQIKKGERWVRKVTLAIVFATGFAMILF
jgi:uncharacterized protein